MSKTILLQPMYSAPKDEPIVVVSAWDQLMIVHWDDGKWRYGPNLGETWDHDYPKGWAKLINAKSWAVVGG